MQTRSVYVCVLADQKSAYAGPASNAKGKCVFVLIAPNDRITSYIAGWVGGHDKI